MYVTDSKASSLVNLILDTSFILDSSYGYFSFVETLSSPFSLLALTSKEISYFERFSYLNLCFPGTI